MIERQLAVFEEDNTELLPTSSWPAAPTSRPGAGEAEERFGDYMDLVEEGEEELLALRDRYAETMAARERQRYEREFLRAARRRMPSLDARGTYERATGLDAP